jgi:hypothetical protein
MLFRISLTCLGVIAVAFAVTGHAQQPEAAFSPSDPAPMSVAAGLDPVAYDQRLAELEASVAQLKRWRCQEQAGWRSSERWEVGYSFLFAKLHYKESFQATSTDLGSGTLNLIPFDQDYELTPRVWLGYKRADGIGLRGSLWNYDHAGDRLNLVNNGLQIPAATATSVIYPSLIVAPFPGDRLQVDTDLKATALDLEATYDLRVKNLDLVLGGGLRYSHFDQHYDAAVIPGPVPFAAPASLNWVREFEGLGPLFTGRGQLPIGCRGFYGTGGINVSFLFGDKNLDRSVVNDATPSPNTTPAQLQFRDSDEIMGIYGAAIGMGWQRRTRWGRCFAEGTYEGQLWTEGGAPTITFAGFNGFALNLGVAR